MKKFFIFSLMAVLALPVFAATTTTTTMETYEDSTVLEPGAYNDGIDEVEVQKMEVEEEKDEIDYSDRTRTNRERKALHTGSHASDDH